MTHLGYGVGPPAGSALSWTNGSGDDWTIQSFDLTDSAGARSWFGDFNGAPITIADGNTFQLAVGAINMFGREPSNASAADGRDYNFYLYDQYGTQPYVKFTQKF